MGGRGFHAQKALINTYIWLALGAAIGFLVGGVIKKGTKTELIESILVGVLGAFIGGEFLAAQFNSGTAAPSFGFALALAVATSFAMLGVLAIFRKAVGPLKQGKSRQKNRG
ncbi:GlsB/YeaQ/YmgE family stress response membrane protein [Caenimonas koreensis]|uniref:Transglycosylase associated protein n=1 Tax=Caenimonas koreensis DSM 17982 TaxID=1121255 RepID=A0A844BAA3_9BURK|nr:hypothetical protein [Caenimonas koreensis]MRD48466.1 hypothetical protein [Caenimonas koreensis DSM 17982]